eukprot:CAMPEP_0171574136 /NCGR_PEP_ID=MMETSP0961-20121227/5171_1 /TAXON_ID=87120 /ORGANISM="Aurantiochytrium limacinum, Strain ATCCMYA-1381" /LENGTH=100 /DNA_ID=CAMNT_0012129381 /DNA_START=524 /DNA_END=827 /DNA_ORIENTATION=-
MAESSMPGMRGMGTLAKKGWELETAHVVASTGGVDEDEDEEGGGGGGEVGGWKACEVTRWQRWIATRTQPAVQSAEVEDEEVQVLELMESEVLPRALLVV